MVAKPAEDQDFPQGFTADYENLHQLPEDLKVKRAGKKIRFIPLNNNIDTSFLNTSCYKSSRNKKIMGAPAHLFIYAGILIIFLLLSLSSFDAESKIPDGKVIALVPGQLETFVVSLGKNAGIQPGDVVQIIRGKTILARAIFTSVQENMGTIVTIGSPTSPIQAGDTVRFEKAGKSSTKEPVSEKDMIRCEYKWKYGQNEYSYSLTLNKKELAAYKRRSRVQGDYSRFVSDPDDDAVISEIASALLQTARKMNFSESDIINFVNSFVQCLQYTPDSTTAGFDNYPRYPIETLVEKGGDCEDMAILVAAILLAIGRDVVILAPPGHVAVGVKVREATSLQGGVIMHNEHPYVYLETTGQGFLLGQIPPQFANKHIEVIEILPRAVFRIVGTFDRTITFDTMSLKFNVLNSGSIAGSFTSRVFLEIEGRNTPYSQIKTEPYTIESGKSAIVSVNLKNPGKGIRCRIGIELYEGYQQTSLLYSEWFTIPQM